ncbi:MAG: hypothetical protein R6X25_03155 [Candidatus Krumholzibacteriia bacterium]
MIGKILVPLPSLLALALAASPAVAAAASVTTPDTALASPTGAAAAGAVAAAAAEGSVLFRLTEPQELAALLGPASDDSSFADGGMEFTMRRWPGVRALFGRMRDDAAPFTLMRLYAGDEELDIGQHRPLVLRHAGDLIKIDGHHGLQGVSLERVDLRDHGPFLRQQRFDSRTRWPAPDRLPAGFDPAELLARGRTPGLGIGTLHEQGIDGRGVGIAVIDQPLLLGHEEYAHAIVRYDATGLAGWRPQMHASPVASLAVGRTMGVAPAAELSFFAVPMWQGDNAPYTAALRKIIALNRTLPADQRIRAVSISSGSFARQPGFAGFEAALAEAEAAGVLVVTCARDRIRYGLLRRRAGADPDDLAGWEPGRYCWEDDALRVPAGGRTLASHEGTDVYVYEVDGGMSWGAPVIAGLAALCFQVAPQLTPAEVTSLLAAAATPCEAGPVIDPRRLVQLARAR